MVLSEWAMPDEILEAKIEEAELEGWEVAEVKEHVAIMKKRSFGSLKVHIPLLLTLGVGNLIYALYRFVRPKKIKLVGKPQEAKMREKQKEKQKQKEELAKTSRETMRTFRKFF